jgi:tRNA-binding protein
VCVANFKPRQIATFVSEVLVSGFADESNRIVLTTVSSAVPNGSKIS